MERLRDHGTGPTHLLDTSAWPVAQNGFTAAKKQVAEIRIQYR